MKLSHLIAQYQAIAEVVLESDIENDPLGVEADHIFKEICRSKPKDSDDIKALAQLASHIINVEEDPAGAVPILHNIVSWASGENPRVLPSNILPFVPKGPAHQ